jgi:hypothetical protein
MNEDGGNMTSVFALHDESGRVHSLVGYEASEGSGMSLVPEPGLTVSEVEAPALRKGVEGLDQLRNLAKDARVEGSGKVKRLIK